MAKTNFTPDELRTIKNIVAKSGLIKAFDGVQWIDLRVVMQNVIDDALGLHVDLEKAQNELSASVERLERLTNPSEYHDGI